MSITAVFEIRLNPSTYPEAARDIADAVRDTRAIPGCQSAELLRAGDDPQPIIVLEGWDSAEHDAAYRQWRAGAGAIVELSGLLVAPPQPTRAVAWEPAT